jgi:cold-inducible RNA-binding protein
MNTKLYVGNLSYSVTDSDLRDLFAPYGAVTDVHVVMDKETRKPRGFAFVTMATKEEADAAIQALNGTDMGGRNLTINEARPREERPAYSGGGGGGGGRGGRRY